MAETQQTDGDQGGIFGNLPRSRPGHRSPRREPGERAAAAEETTERPRLEPRPRPSPTREPPAPSSEPNQAPSTAPADEERIAGLEDLAWAGIAVTAEAATLGLRLAGKAFERARDAVERR